MSVIIRLQNLPLTASSLDIRNFFHGLSIPDGGVHIVGGPEGDAFIAFSTDEDARQAMRLTGQPLKDSRVSLLLSSRNEMYKVIEQARLAAMGGGPPSSSSGSASSSMHSHHHHHHLNEDSSPPSSHHHLSSQAPPPSHLSHGYNHNHHSSGNTGSNTMSPPSSGSNDYMKNFGGAGQGGPPADLNPNPALLFSAMSSIPSATLGGATAPASAYLNQQQQQHNQYPGLGSSSHQQNPAAPGGGPGSVSNLPFGVGNNPVAALANGANPFLNFPPPSNLAGLPFSSILQSQGQQGMPHSAQTPSSNNPLAQAGNLGGMNPTTAGGMSGLLQTSQNMNTTMSMAGQGTSPMNPFGTAPSRMGLMNNGHSNSNGPNTNAPLQGGPRHGNNFGSGMQNQYGAGVGAGMGGLPPRQPGHMGPRTPFGTHATTMPTMTMNNSGAPGPGGGEIKNRFQFGAIPSGRADIREREGIKDIRNNRSDSRERRGVEPPPPRRRRSRSRERDRGTERRRRRSKSRSRSRSRSRDRSGIKRRDSRDKRDPERKSRSDSSPEKSSQDSSTRSRREQDPSPSPTSANTTNEEWPGAKLTGIPNDASYREIKEFIRAEVMGGSDGVVRLYDDGIAYLKLQSPQDFPRVFKSNGRKLRGSVVSIEGILMETWTQEYKLNKSRIERDIDREKEEREKEQEKESRRTERGDRDHRHHSSHSSSTHHRSSRFSNASHESNCIAIRGLAPTITRHELATRYLQDTPCEDIVLIAAPTPTNRHSVTAFIQFESALVAQTIIDLIARSPLGTSLVVESCDPDDLQRAKARTTPGALGGGNVGNNSFGNARSGGMSQDAKSIFDLDVSLDDETTTVIMKGAPPNISERDVFDFFSDIGLAPMNVKIFHDADGQCSGNVICEFADNNKAKRATTKDGMLFGRGQISVSLLPSRNKRNIAGPGNLSSLGGVGGNDFGQQQQNPFGMSNRSQPPQRPGLLGTGPNRAAAEPPMSRFNNPTSSPNIFEQALQQQIVPGGGGGGGGTRGGLGGRGGRGSSGERPSRFNSANDSRGDYRSQNGFRGRGRGGRGGSGPGQYPKGKHDDFSTGGSEEPDLGIFNKKGCVIGLENIPYKASMDDILNYLEDVLKIRIAPNMIIRRFDDNQKPTGDARVAFNTEFEAKLACDRLKGTYMWKRLISATPDPDFYIDPPTSSTDSAIARIRRSPLLCQGRLRKSRAISVEV